MNPQFQRFSLIELNELHHQIAAMGAMLRLHSGDPSGWQSLGTNLAGFLQNRAAAMQVAQTLPARVRQNPAMRQVMALTEQSNQQVTQYMPQLTQTLAATGAPQPGPLMVGMR